MINTYQLQRAIARYARGRTRSTAEIELAWVRLAVQLQAELSDQHEVFNRDHGVFVATFFRDRLGDILRVAEAARQAVRDAASQRSDAAYDDPKNRAVRAARRAAINAAHRALGDATEAKHRSLGIERYRWISSRDARVRRRHRELDKTIHRWSDPPISNPDTGRRAHPGQDYGCRCTASPILDDVEALLSAPAEPTRPARRAAPARPPRVPAVSAPTPTLTLTLTPTPTPIPTPTPDVGIWARLKQWILSRHSRRKR